MYEERDEELAEGEESDEDVELEAEEGSPGGELGREKAVERSVHTGNR